MPDKELCLREALAVCTPPAPEPSAKPPASVARGDVARERGEGDESSGQVLCAQAWKPGSQHAGEKRGVADLLLGRTERAARAAELQLCAQAR